MDLVIVILAAFNILVCYGVNLKQQMDHIGRVDKNPCNNDDLFDLGYLSPPMTMNAEKYSKPRRTRTKSLGYSNLIPESRRYLSFHPGHKSVILGVPSAPSHLPEAESILPGHTLIRPALGMLKSAVKFPHTDWDSGSGVYGNMNNLGITWDGTSDRVLYTGFRRANNDYPVNHDSFIMLRLRKIVISCVSHCWDRASSIIGGKLTIHNTLVKRLLPHKTKSLKSVIILLLRDPSEQKDKSGYMILSKREKSNSRQRDKQNDEIKKILYKVLRDVRRGEIRSSEEYSLDPEESPKSLKPNPKLSWLLHSKDTFNHIKINPEAPKWTELMPVTPDQNAEQGWSFFSQDASDFFDNRK